MRTSKMTSPAGPDASRAPSDSWTIGVIVNATEHKGPPFSLHSRPTAAMALRDFTAEQIPKLREHFGLSSRVPEFDPIAMGA